VEKIIERIPSRISARTYILTFMIFVNDLDSGVHNESDNEIFRRHSVLQKNGIRRGHSVTATGRG